ncbi:uncharacterized protein [Aristolochia californica]|uniref:uncharacterized protein isoform X2 n=1 Tax=Aristolochia californica TaxID=171875 RepID=UPI0035D57DBB
MEFSLSGNALKTFHRAVTCLARVGNELFIQASASHLGFQTLNSSRSAYQAITLKADFFDAYTLSTAEVQCSVLLKAVCSILRTPIASIDHLFVILPNADATKVQWTLDCYNGMKKSYWISCNIEPDIQHLSLDRTKFPSSFIVRPADLNRLLANFQSSLQEITILATEPTAQPDSGVAVGGKALELRSYIDPTKDNSDASLHTQLWLDPAEEFLQYKHGGDAVDVTFSVKELKAFLTFCEGCEVDIHLFFEKAGDIDYFDRPILMAPKFGLDDGSNSEFDAMLVLATMLTSLLHLGSTSEPPQGAAGLACNHPIHASAQATATIGDPSPVSEHHSNHTRIWSDLSGSAAKSSAGLQERNAPSHCSGLNPREQYNLQRLTRMDITSDPPVRDKAPHSTQSQVEGGQSGDSQGVDNHQRSQHHPGNWISAGDDVDDEEDDGEIYVQSTP